MLKIDKASCLCLDTRWDTREKDIRDIELRLSILGTKIEFFTAGNGQDKDIEYDYIDDPNPDVSRWGYGREGFKHHHWNAFQCHQIMIQRAKDEHRQNLLMLEDDAYLTDRFEEIWSVAQTRVPDFDILYLGWWIGTEGDDFNEKVEKNYREKGIIGVDKVRQVGGLHGALINNSMFDFLLSLPANNPIDCQLNRYHHQIKSYYLFPKIIHTRTCYSECEGSIIERHDL